jgi:hypothetical protein
MDEAEDQELKGKSALTDGISSDYDPFANGLFIVGLVKEQVEACGLFINELYQKKREGNLDHQITRNALTMLRGAIFALGTQKIKNPEWKEQCASSLRETLHEWSEGRINNDFLLFYRNRGEKLAADESEVLKELTFHYQYFSGIDHHNASRIQASLIALLKNNSLKLEDCYKDEVFIERVKIFFSNWLKIKDFSEKNNK